MMMKPVEDVFLVVDVQYDFMPGGALAVAHGDEVVPVINALARGFSHVVLTQDWHPRSHVSFAANHAGRQPFEMMTLPYGEQVLWPVHCVQDTQGAALHRDLHVPHARLVTVMLSNIEGERLDEHARRITAFFLESVEASGGPPVLLRASGTTKRAPPFAYRALPAPGE